MSEIVGETFSAVHSEIDSKRRLHCFEIFGYDFMVDTELNV